VTTPVIIGGMTKGHLKFARMLADLELSEREAAERLECSQTLVNYLKRGLRDPGRGLAARIKALSLAEWSGGAIETEAWDQPAKPAKSRATGT
jgi:hypothetical protein